MGDHACAPRTCGGHLGASAFGRLRVTCCQRHLSFHFSGSAPGTSPVPTEWPTPCPRCHSSARFLSPPWGQYLSRWHSLDTKCLLGKTPERLPRQISWGPFHRPLSPVTGSPWRPTFTVSAGLCPNRLSGTARVLLAPPTAQGIPGVGTHSTGTQTPSPPGNLGCDSVPSFPPAGADQLVLGRGFHSQPWVGCAG